MLCDPSTQKFQFFQKQWGGLFNGVSFWRKGLMSLEFPCDVTAIKFLNNEWQNDLKVMKENLRENA